VADHKNTGITYITRRDPEPFIMAPREMVEFDAERPLGTTARLVRLYLHDLSRRPNWTIYVSQIQRALGISEVTWRSARKELEKQGFYRAQRRRTADGKWEWLHFAFRDPVAPDDPTIPHLAMDGQIKDGEAIHRQVGDKRSTTPHNKTKQKSSSTACARDTSSASAAGEEKIYIKRPSGLVCWYRNEIPAAVIVEETYSPAEIQAGIAKVAARGKDPVCGLVAREIECQRAARASVDQAKAREEIGPIAEVLIRRAELADPARRVASDAAARVAAEKLGFGHIFVREHKDAGAANG